MNLEEFRKQSQTLKDQNKQFLSRLKKANPRKLDSDFHEAHSNAFDRIDCLTCANCCKTTSPIFKQKDIENVAKHIRISPSQFIDKYLHLDKDNDYVLNSAPCPFLDGDNYCLIYESRPTACRGYPHTNRKKMFQLLDLTYKNTLVCPAVLDIVEQLKKVK
ncbi:MAG: YkgJ family cysteine cluster protein [Bacteroidota bacterium]|nr:YkgJ family cysteine cluster protein [Bacteroidota bacterium]